MTVKAIQPQELKHYWPEIKSGLEKVLQKTPTADWIPEEVFSAIYMQKSVCIVGLVDEEVDWGFVGHALPNGLFFVWAGWSTINTYLAFQTIDDVAKRLGCHRVRFETDRKGWQKVATQYGYKPAAWVKEL